MTILITIFRQYAIFNVSIFVLILSQVDINTRLDPDGIWMPKHRLCCAAYRMSGAFVACFRNLPDVYIRHVESCLEKGFIATSPRSSKQKITPKSLQNPVKKAPRISTISFWRSPSKRCEMKKKNGWFRFPWRYHPGPKSFSVRYHPDEFEPPASFQVSGGFSCWYRDIDIRFIHWYHFISHFLILKTFWNLFELARQLRMVFLWKRCFWWIQSPFPTQLRCFLGGRCQAVWWNARHSGVGSWGVRSTCERDPLLKIYMFLK